jgi:tetratricopeptide (TPR) repeat protein
VDLRLVYRYRQSQMGEFPNNKVVNSVRRALLAGLCVAFASMQLAGQAADFSKAKQTYVPPSRIIRPNNYESSREAQSLGVNPNAKPVPKLSSAQVTRVRLGAESLIKQGRFEQANQLLKQCFAAQSGNSLVQNDLLKVNLARSRQFQKAKKLDKAIEASREAIYFSPNSTIAEALLALQLKEKGIDPNNAAVRLKMADKLYSSGKLPDALVEYCQSYKLAPSAAACAGLGTIYQIVGKPRLAEQQFKLALQMDPRCEQANQQVGLLCLADKDTVGANSYLSRALEEDGNDTVASKALIDLWQHQISLSTNSANAHMGLARAYQLSGQLDLAANEYNTVARIEPENPNLSVARETLQHAVVHKQSTLAIAEARALESEGSFEQAKNRIGEALASDPTNSELLLLQGELLEKLGKAGDAADAYRAVLYADPKNEEAARRLKNLSVGTLNFGMLPVPVPASASASDTVVLPAGSDVAKLTNFILDLHGYIADQRKAIKTARRGTTTKPKS